jgi:hypothetical protein
LNAGGPAKRFSVVLIKPSHYDDDGYLIQWFRYVEIEVSAFDETNTRGKKIS